MCKEHNTETGQYADTADIWDNCAGKTSRSGRSIRRGNPSRFGGRGAEAGTTVTPPRAHARRICLPSTFPCFSRKRQSFPQVASNERRPDSEARSWHKGPSCGDMESLSLSAGAILPYSSNMLTALMISPPKSHKFPKCFLAVRSVMSSASRAEINGFIASTRPCPYGTSSSIPSHCFGHLSHSFSNLVRLAIGFLPPRAAWAPDAHAMPGFTAGDWSGAFQ